MDTADEDDLELLTDEELEQELTIAASHAGLHERNEALLAERRRRLEEE